MTALTEREVQSIFDQLERLNEKVDRNQLLIHEVARLDQQHRDMHGDVFGEGGLSNRVRHAEHTLVRHKVVIGIITALTLAATVALANRALGAKGRETAAELAR